MTRAWARRSRWPIRTSAWFGGTTLHSAEFDQWAEEHLTSFNKWVKFVHTKIVLVDPMTRSPTVITGSANYSDNSTTDNEENSVLVREDGSGAATRVADIYLTEYQRLFIHFVFRSWASRSPTVAGAGPGTWHLIEDDSWSVDYFAAGSWRSRQRQTFAAPR